MSRVDPVRTPADATFDHALSGRKYQVFRRDGQVWHRELLLSSHPEEILLAEFPVIWVVGSGRHSLTYLAEADGFLVESPITWYASKQSWGMSPGYDRPDHLSFERAAGEGCLDCHAGRAVAIDGSLHRMQILEASIGCERCHGPGERHVARHHKSPHGEFAPTNPPIDPTIVNPAHLSRDLGEAICQQCHLRSHASVLARGKALADFRPGLRLQDFREDFALQTPDLPLTVVGHVEQLHLSRCYQQSPQLTCRTCHDPHGETAITPGPSVQNANCARCHDESACGVTPGERNRRSPTNNCIECHMPKSETEIPHLAFTHHRIGIHRAGDRRPTDPRPTPQGQAELRPFHGTEGVSEADRQRSLGLAWLEAGARQEDSRTGHAHRALAWLILQKLHPPDAADGVVQTALARLAFELQTIPAEPFARAALIDPGLAGQDRCNALFLLANSVLQRRDHRAALPLAEELTRLRRHSTDWLMLADCRRATGGDGVAELERALQINPRLNGVRQFLVQHYQEAGAAEDSQRHVKRLELVQPMPLRPPRQ